ncbi:TraR/DksA family transcriptional regulator [Profundibacter amoris]|uniref:TraR/DksA family transcriptional regulator n=1 Tax=Profundibacter amoris TaxID=2171755 RepID=A0A347ULJ1_9RHOB|nr:TraR/DksA C4-type zinc finger protein [Profundibacter amoris]AXX99719.1 TraR/DksA family transcriptional regulator [Profundibacter amoris]
MNDSDLAHFRTLLLTLQNELTDQGNSTKDARKTVVLDQQSVGRLSRMNAMQQQAMAKATQTRRDHQGLRIKAALERMDQGEYGYCTDCGEDIALKRLQLDPTVPTCISCASG